MMVYCCFSRDGNNREAEGARRRKAPGGGKSRETERTGIWQTESLRELKWYERFRYILEI